MQEALAEARKGLGSTSPNPAVGAVIVRGGKIIARGHHRYFGGPHAEVEALSRLSRKDAARRRDLTLVVTLEPCNHYGKTPPCTEAILRTGIRRVIVGMLDPHKIVAGQGVQRLRRAGVHVTVMDSPDVLDFYRPYTTYQTNHQQHRPYVTLKLALSADGKIARRGVKWITGPAARREVQRIRSQVDGILIGRRTAVLDNPRLTVRGPLSKNRTKLPTRIILTRTAKLPPGLRLLRDGLAPTLIVSPKPSLQALLANLAKKGFVHLLIEGGSITANAFLEQNLVDEIHLFISPKILGPAALPAFTPHQHIRPYNVHWILRNAGPIGQDIRLTFQKINS